jgi:hypothetical protein
MRTKTAAQDCRSAYIHTYIHMYQNTYILFVIYECLYWMVFLYFKNTYMYTDVFVCGLLDCLCTSVFFIINIIIYF